MPLTWLSFAKGIHRWVYGLMARGCVQVGQAMILSPLTAKGAIRCL